MTDTGLELNDGSHVYLCSTCSHSGTACLEALWLCQTVGQAQQRSGHVLPASSELVAAGAFHGCGLPCNVLLRVGPDGVEVTAGMSDNCDEGETFLPAARVAARRVAAQTAPTGAPESGRADQPIDRGREEAIASGDGAAGYPGFAVARAPATS